jgi:hypothetical protein
VREKLEERASRASQTPRQSMSSIQRRWRPPTSPARAARPIIATPNPLRVQPSNPTSCASLITVMKIPTSRSLGNPAARGSVGCDGSHVGRRLRSAARATAAAVKSRSDSHRRAGALPLAGSERDLVSCGLGGGGHRSSRTRGNTFHLVAGGASGLKLSSRMQRRGSIGCKPTRASASSAGPERRGVPRILRRRHPCLR